MKLTEKDALEYIKNKLIELPLVKKVDIPVECFHTQSDLEITLFDHNKIGIHITSYNEVCPRHIKKIIESKSNEIGHKYPVIVSPYISDIVHDLCKENGIGYFDLSGNCLLSTTSIYVSEKGNKNKYKSNAKKNNIFNPKSIVSSKLLRILIKNKNIPYKLKALSEEAGCSIGQVSKVKEALYNKDMAEFNEAGIQLTNIKTLMNEWALEYEKMEKNKRLCYTLDSISNFEQNLQSMKDEKQIDYYLTGFSGGVRYTPVVRYNKIHVYIPSIKMEEAIEFLNCKEVTSGANIVIYPLENEVTIYDSRFINHSSVVSPVQAYLDCMNIKGRGEEMAEEVFRKEINYK